MESSQVVVFMFMSVTFPLVLQEHDGADDLLNAERAHLLNCKKALEAQLRSVQQQLQVCTY